MTEQDAITSSAVEFRKKSLLKFKRFRVIRFVAGKTREDEPDG